MQKEDGMDNTSDDQARKKQEQIFTPAREAINYLFARMVANHGYSASECGWLARLFTPTEIAEQSEIKFVFTTTIKDILEEQHLSYSKHEKLLSAQIGKSNLWEITVKALGIESYYIARLLFMAVNKMARKQRSQEELDKKLINMYIGFARSRSMGLPKKIPINLRDEKYILSIPLANDTREVSYRNIDTLCAYIGREFKGCVEF